jgi:hypothetical protein
MRAHISKQFAKVTRNPGDNPEQLQMFMRPHEILNKIYSFSDDLGDDDALEHLDDPRGYPNSQLHADKLGEAIDSGLHDGIETDGILNHVVLETSPHTSKFRMGNGHHRLSVALDLESKGHQVDIPVIHDNNFMYDTTDEYKHMYGRPKKYFGYKEN